MKEDFIVFEYQYGKLHNIALGGKTHRTHMTPKTHTLQCIPKCFRNQRHNRKSHFEVLHTRLYTVDIQYLQYCLLRMFYIRLGRFGTPCIIQLFLGTPLIDIHEKLHSSSQNSKTRAGAGLDDINMDQSETRHIRSGFWLVHIYIFKASSGPGLWVLWWTMQLFINVYQISTQK